MKVLKTVLLILIGSAVLAAVGVYSGLFNFAADDPHWGVTARIVESARERSIESQSASISAPANLQDSKIIASGAGEYAEMCTGCHLAPGMKDTEMRTGLYPKPPNLAEHGTHRAPAQQFWIIKHGLKMTGMPAWGLTHDDDRIWSMVAFLQKLPDLTPEAYHELVESGEGGHHHHETDEAEHSHEAGSDEGHEHESGEAGELPSGAPPAHQHEHGADEHAAPSQKMPAATAGAAAAVDRFQSLLAKGETAEAAKVLDGMVLIYESGEAERSRAEYAAHHLPADAAFLKGASVRVLSRTGNAVGDLAWIATESEIKKAGSKPVNLVATEPKVLKRDANDWHIAHIHWSSRSGE
jgi:mono/diheme cytochrome c family protein